MLIPADFRLLPFNFNAIADCGRYISNKAYWRLYSTENLFRIIIHSVLFVQISPDWWIYAVDQKVQKRAYSNYQSYRGKTWFGKVGNHGIYYVYLKDLGEIMRTNSNLLLPVIPNIYDWIVEIEKIRIARNLVAHMNFLDANDETDINTFYIKCKKLIPIVQASVELIIP